MSQKNLSNSLKQPQKIDLFSYEKQLWQKGYNLIAGTDEAGRGPLAGPLVAAAVIFPTDYKLPFRAPLINDSKTLTPKKRILAFDFIFKEAISVTWVIKGPKKVDEKGPLKCSLTAMGLALEALEPKPDFALVDGRQELKISPCLAKSLIKGDRLSFSIAAASIVAKVIRDKLMAIADLHYPQYSFKTNQGYGTKAHLLALRKHGHCPYHRLSYRGVLTPKNQIDFNFD